VNRAVPPRPSKNPTLLACSAAFLAAAVAHVVAWWQYRADPFSTTYVADALSYHRWALRLIENGLAAEPVFHQPPLYPLLLAAVYSAAGEQTRAIWSIGLQVLLGSAAIALLVPLGRIWFGRLAVGVAAAALALLHAPFVFYSLKLLPVAAALVTQATGLIALGWVRSRPTPLPAFLAGAAWGLAAITRAEALLFVPLAIVWLVIVPKHERNRRVALAALYGAGLVLIVAPVTLHNLRHGDRVVIASAVGENLYIGNQRGAEGGYRAITPGAGDIFSQRVTAKSLAEAELGRALRPSQVSAFWRAKALDEIAADPGGWLALEARKLARILHPGDPTDIYSFALERRSYLQSLYLLPVTPWMLLLLGAVGLGHAMRRALPGSWPLLLWVAVQLLVLLLFFVDARLRLPLFFALCPFAGLAVVETYRRATVRRGVTLALALALAGAWIAGLVTTRPRARDAVRLASVLSIQGQLDESLDALAPYLEGSRRDATALDQAGWVLQKKGDLEAARRRYEEALRDLPTESAHQTHTRLGQVYERLGHPERAAAQHDLAVENDRANAGTFFERALFRLRRGNETGAVEDLHRAAALDPAWPAPSELLGRLEAD
jgi:tetratricopeptide (TPR) repeat protein